MRIDKIKKRSGIYCKLNPDRIKASILKAAGEAKEEIKDIDALVKKVVHKVASAPDDRVPHVDDIEDAVEACLLECGYIKTCHSYILYRDKKRTIRDVIGKHTNRLVDQYLNGGDWKVKENANITYSLHGLNFYISSLVSKQYFLDTIFTPEIKKLHETGAFYIHDLGSLSAYCTGWDLLDLLQTGLRGSADKTASSPPKHFDSAVNQTMNFLYLVQSNVAGAVSLSNFDSLLAPYAKKDKLSYKEIKQALQSFIYSLNQPMRIGAQSLFVNLTVDLVPTSSLVNLPIIDGITPGECLNEINMINRALFEIMLEGDTVHKVFTFPIITLNITEDFFKLDRKLLDLIFTATAKYGPFYFGNFVSSGMDVNDIRSMCCRLRLNLKEVHSRIGSLFGPSGLTGSVSVVTINLPQLALETSTDEEFFERLDYLLHKGRLVHKLRRKFVEQATENGLYPYCKFYLRGVKERTGSYWSNHFSTFGIIGAEEMCRIKFNSSIQDKYDFISNLLQYINKKIHQFQIEDSVLYNLEQTPCESASMYLAKLDASRYRNAFYYGEVPKYTNSTHLPVHEEDLAAHIENHDLLDPLYSGGTVWHAWVGEQLKAEHCESFVKFVCAKTRIPYFTITPTFTICLKDGYFSGEHKTCPQCGGETLVYSRIVGYLRPVSSWNTAKQEEFELRETFKIEIHEQKE
jgi:anaerobic ribonucleoside-triphosphate reductase